MIVLAGRGHSPGSQRRRGDTGRQRRWYALRCAVMLSTFGSGIATRAWHALVSVALVPTAPPLQAFKLVVMSQLFTLPSLIKCLGHEARKHYKVLVVCLYSRTSWGPG